MLVLTGHSGCGKTKIANACTTWAQAVAYTALERGYWKNSIPSVAFRSWPELANDFSEKDFSAIPDLVQTKFLAMDDVGAENDPWKVSADKLCQVLSRRETMWTIVTTNVLTENWPQRFDARIADRLLRNSVVVDMRNVPSFSSL